MVDFCHHSTIFEVMYQFWTSLDMGWVGREGVGVICILEIAKEKKLNNMND